MVALPVLIAPFRALLGFKSDTYKSSIGWKRIPYLWFGTLWQFGGLAIMPASLLVLGGDTGAYDIPYAGEVLAALAFLMTGLGHAHDPDGGPGAGRRPRDGRDPAAGRGAALRDVPGRHGRIGRRHRLAPARVHAAGADPGDPGLCGSDRGAERHRAVEAGTRAPDDQGGARGTESPSFADAWADYASGGTAGRLLVVVFLGTMAFNMQDVLLEPYGGEILGLSVSATTLLTATWAGRADRVSRLRRAGWPRGSTPTGWARAASSRAGRVFGRDLLQPLGIG
jgi:BCD family chlorophyll transporter-like MFS transporter